MKKLAILTAAALSLASASAAPAQQVKGGETGLKGTIVTGSCQAGPGVSCTILSAPEKGGLVITTACLTTIDPAGNFGFVLNGAPLFPTCLSNFGASPASSLPVGYVVAPGQAFECSNPAAATNVISCTASGVLTKK